MPPTNIPLSQNPLFHFSIIPTFHYSNWGEAPNFFCEAFSYSIFPQKSTLIKGYYAKTWLDFTIKMSRFEQKLFTAHALKFYS